MTLTQLKALCPDAEMLRAAPGKELGTAALPTPSAAASLTVLCKHFWPFFTKAKIVFGFLSVSENRC